MVGSRNTWLPHFSTMDNERSAKGSWQLMPLLRWLHVCCAKMNTGPNYNFETGSLKLDSQMFGSTTIPKKMMMGILTVNSDADHITDPHNGRRAYVLILLTLRCFPGTTAHFTTNMLTCWINSGLSEMPERHSSSQLPVTRSTQPSPLFTVQAVPDQLSRGSIREPAVQRGRSARCAEGRLPALVQCLSLPRAECAKVTEGRSSTNTGKVLHCLHSQLICRIRSSALFVQTEAFVHVSGSSSQL